MLCLYKTYCKNIYVCGSNATMFPSELSSALGGYLLEKALVEHYKILNISVVRYFVKRVMANLIKPTSINDIYKDVKSQGLKVEKDDLYLWVDYICDIFLFVCISKYDRSLVRE